MTAYCAHGRSNYAYGHVHCSLRKAPAPLLTSQISLFALMQLLIIKFRNSVKHCLLCAMQSDTVLLTCTLSKDINGQQQPLVLGET